MSVTLLGSALLGVPGVAGAAGPVDASAVRGGVTRTLPARLDAAVCPRYSGLNTTNLYSAVMGGYFTGTTHQGVRVVDSNGHVNWGADPFGDASWTSWLDSLKWLGALVTTGGGESIRNPNGTVTTPTPAQRWDGLDRALAITHDFVLSNPRVTSAPTSAMDGSMGHRVQFLGCLIETLGPDLTPAWLTAAALDQARWLTSSRHYRGAWNQGMDQDLGVLTAGCATGDQSLQQVAATRLHTALDATIDTDGVPVEQAPGYASYQYRLWSTIAQSASRCGMAGEDQIASRSSRIGGFLTQATEPDGDLTQLGDTTAEPVPTMPGTEYAASHGATGTVPALNSIYRTAGFVFARSSWSPMRTASYYTIRFGPPIAFHGHNDRTAITWTVAGVPRLVDSGHIGYSQPAARVYLRSDAAHNVFAPTSYPGFRPASTPAYLTRSSVGARADSYTVTATPYGYSLGGRTRTTSAVRNVLVVHGPDLIITRDSAGGAPRPVVWRAHWHLPHGWSARVLGVNSVEARAGSARTTLLRIPLGRGTLRAGTVTTYVAPRIGVRESSVDVQFPTVGRSGALLSIIAPVAASGVWASLSGRTLRVHVGQVVVTVDIARDGTLTRVS